MFDDDGSQTDITTGTGRWLVEYNGENRPVRWSRPKDGAVIEMSYDRMGRRVVNDGRVYVWDDFNIIIEDAASVNAIFNTWGTDINGIFQGAGGVGGLLAVERAGRVYLPFYDANGNVSKFVEETGEESVHYAYSAVGKQLVVEDSIGFSHRFSTKPYCSKMGLVAYEMREYVANTGRWCSRDRMDVLNTYSYVCNDVLSRYDMLGLYGNPIVGPGGNIWGPSIPSDPGGPYNPYPNRDVPWYEQLPDCPCSIPIQPGGCPEPVGAGEGWFSPEKTRHKGGSWEIRSNPTSTGTGQQCVYDAKGNLINHGSGAGTPDIFSPVKWRIAPHILFEVLPYFWNLARHGEIVAEELDHKEHPPNQGKDDKGNPCPSNDGRDAPFPDCNPCK